MSFQHIATLVLEGILGLFAAYAAYSLFAWTPPSITKGREALHYPRWFWVFAGFIASIGAIGLFVGLVIPVVGALAAIWMVAYFVVAFFAHLIRLDLVSLPAPFILLAVFVGLVLLRWSDAGPALTYVGLQ